MAKIGSNPEIAPGDFYYTSVTPQATVGSRYDSADGRSYRYVQFGSTTNLVAGNLVQGAVSTANHQNIAPTANAGTGSYVVTVTLGATAATVGQYANGYLSVVTGTSHLGWTYSIVSNSAAPSSGTQCLITLAEPLQVALLTTDTVSLTPNPYTNVVQMPTTSQGIPVGVALTAGTINWYGYVQTRGPASVLSDATTAAIGTSVQPSTTTAGSVTQTAGTGAFYVGMPIVATVSARTNPVFLEIE
jgi:hypothetical protein